MIEWVTLLPSLPPVAQGWNERKNVRTITLSVWSRSIGKSHESHRQFEDRTQKRVKEAGERGWRWRARESETGNGKEIVPGSDERRVIAMKLPIDTSAITFMMGGSPEPVKDFDTKQAKVNEDGEVLFSFPLVAFGESGADLLTVKVPGAPAGGLKQGTPVKVEGLVASTWSMDKGRSGVSFKASRIEALSGSAAARAS
jgi:hypothetical protein